MRIAPLFHDHAVLQRDISIAVWGIACRDESVTVTLGGQAARTIAGSDGRWIVRMPAMAAGGPYELTAESSSGRVIARDILIGEVWICSGQSNMEFTLSQSKQLDEAGDEVGLSKSQIRLLTVSNPARIGRQEAIDGSWTVGTPEALAAFSAIGGWFGRELQRHLGVPIGLICTAWGGTRIQSWISREALVRDPLGLTEIRQFEADVFSPDHSSVVEFGSFQEWERLGAPQDNENAGLKKGWASPTFDDFSWHNMPLPGRWQEHGHPENGVFWFRRTVTVPMEWKGRDLELHLGMIDKHDDTWVNGELIGSTSWEAGPNAWSTPRVYTVPGRLVGADGSLCLAVRARSHVFHGGLIGPSSEMRVAPASEPEAAPISLAGSWHYAIEQNWGVVTPPDAKWSVNTPNSPAILFDSRIAPLLPFAIRGVIWYQGENNVSQARDYRRLLPLMIRDWRHSWGQGDFPFLQVQLANYLVATADPGSSSAWAELRDAQAAALTEPNTGMAVAIDVGDSADIHPLDKRSVGLRLALWALAETYGHCLVPSGPLYASVHSEVPGRVRIRFHHANGLHTRDGGPVGHIAIAGIDRVFMWAECEIDGESLIARHPQIAHPVAVRYAWADNPVSSNLVNGAGLPAAPFRTDDW